MSLNWNLLSKYRGQLCGISILWVMLFHLTEIKKNKLPYVLQDLYGFLVHGNLGVEIFLFLSGMGLFYSLKNSNDITEFYNKRVKKILLPYLLISGTYFFINNILVSNNVTLFLKNITMYSFWAEGNRAVWFICIIVPLYIVYPFLHKYIFEDKKALLWLFLIILLLYVGIYLLKVCDLKAYVKIEIALTRIPVFLSGCYFGKLSYENKELGIWEKVLILFLLIMGLYAFDHKNFSLLTWKLMRIPYFILGIVFPWFFIILLEFINSNRLNKMLCYMGGISLELYLSHVALEFTLIKTNIWKAAPNGIYLFIL